MKVKEITHYLHDDGQGNYAMKINADLEWVVWPAIMDTYPDANWVYQVKENLNKPNNYHQTHCLVISELLSVTFDILYVFMAPFHSLIPLYHPYTTLIPLYKPYKVATVPP